MQDKVLSASGFLRNADETIGGEDENTVWLS